MAEETATREEKRLNLQVISEGGISWLYMEKPTPLEGDYLRQSYSFNALNIDDIMSRVQRPKIDEYLDHLFIVLHFPIYIKEMRTTGTQSISRLWNQIKADITGLPVISQRVPEGEMLGAAMIAAYGSGDYQSIQEASRCMAHPKERFDPDVRRGDVILEQFRRAASSVSHTESFK